MTVFAAYAKYYDLLYRDKNYAAEADYVTSKLRRLGGNVGSILELGCGTAAHACLLAQLGYVVHGVDMSEGMLAGAQMRRERLDRSSAAAVSLSLGDVRTIRLGRTFDAVISLFHVFSYQTSNDDLQAAFATAKAHLRPGGLLLFDCWHGPAVLTIGPTTTVKRFENETMLVTRIAEPVLDVSANTVEVNYDIAIREKGTGTVQQIKERHTMRYLFTPEVKMMCRDAGLELVDASEWMTDAAPSASAWAACFVARG